MFARTAAEIDLQGEPALIAVEVGQPDLGEVETGVPHQRSVGVDPEIVGAAVVAEQRKPRLFDDFIRQSPVRRESRGAGALFPHREHLRREAQQ